MRPIEEYFLSRALLPESRAIYQRAVMIRPIPDLYHYTSVEGMRSILTSRAIWATDCRCLNDTSELDYAEGLIRETVQAESEAASTACREFLLKFSYVIRYMAGRARINVASFCEQGDSLGQWYAYARTGVSIGLSGSALEHLPDCFIVKVEYQPAVQRQLVRDTLALHLPPLERAFAEHDQQKVISVSGALASQLALYASAFKNPYFADEREWRMVTGGTPENMKVRQTSGWDQPYVELSLEVQIGGGVSLVTVRHSPLLDPASAKKALEDTLRILGYDPAAAASSDIPLRRSPGA